MDYLKSQEQLVKTVIRSGNSGSVYVPKEWIGERVVIKPLSIRDRILQITAPYMENVIGIYLYGSYARGEEIPESDIDILVITDKKIPLNRQDNIDIEAVEIADIKGRIMKDWVGYYSIIHEAKPIINEKLLEELKGVKPDPKALKWYYNMTKNALSIVNDLLEIKGDMNGSIYSLMLRIRGLYLIQCNLKGRKYSNKDLEDFIVKNGIKRQVYRNFYTIYRAVRDNKPLPSYEIDRDNLERLHEIAVQILQELKNAKQRKKGKEIH